MKDWRSRGYVQDSEDEDERSEESQNLQNEEDELKPRDAATDPEPEPRIETEAGNNGQDARDEKKDSIEGGEEDDFHTERVQERVAVVNDGELSEDELAMNWPSRKAPPQQSSPKTPTPRSDPAIHDESRTTPQSSPLSSPLPELAELIGGVQHVTFTHGAARSSPRIFVSSPPVPQVDLTAVADCEEEVVEENAGVNEIVNLEVRDHWAAPQRNFRQRKPIQLNPYQIMDGQYMQKMKSHGVRPTRVVQPSTTDRHHNNQDSDSQSMGGNDTQSVYESPPQPRPRPRTLSAASPAPARVQRVERQARSSSPPSMTFDEDDLPSLETLLHHGARKSKVYLGSKRRKLMHSSRPQQDQIETLGIQGSRGEPGLDRRHPGMHAPLSPATSPRVSHDLPTMNGRNGFRFIPIAVSPQKPPTPATSSSANGLLQRRRQLTSGGLSSPAPGELSARRRSVAEPTIISDEEEDCDSDSQSSSSLREAPDKETGRLKVIQRRIKGVLPASWLKLDVKAQGKLPAPRLELRRSEEPVSYHPGVARRTFKIPGTARVPLDVLAISSGEDSEKEVSKRTTAEPVSPTRQPKSTRNEPVPSLFLDDDPGDRMEDNAFDFMLPGASRNSHAKISKSQKRQTRVTDSFAQTRKKHRLQGDQRKRSKTMTPRVARPKPPRLSILDATSRPEDSTTTPLPSFVKVARRQARRYPEQARRRPAQHVRLQTREDTHEVQAVLSAWHAGKITRKSPDNIGTLTKRSPLVPIGSDMRQPPLQFGTEAYKAMPSAFNGDVAGRANYGPKRMSTAKSNTTKSIRRREPKQAPYLHEGQLETEDATTRSLQDRLQFHQVLRNEDQEYSAVRHTAAQPLPRTLDELEAQITRRRESKERSGLSNRDAVPHQPVPERVVRSRRLRKTHPKRIDVEIAEYRQPVQITLPQRERSASVQVVVDVVKGGEVLQDLHPWGLPYSHAFDVLPLPIGTYFHGSTFLGSGALKSCFEVPLKRDLDLVVDGTHVILLAGESYCWGPWSEELAMNVQQILSHVANGVTLNTAAPGSESDQLVQTLLDANARWLSFSDAIDRKPFARTFFDELEEVQMKMEVQTTSRTINEQSIRTAARLLVLTSQVLIMYNTAGVDKEIQGRGEKLMRRQADMLMASVCENGIENIRAFLDNIRRHAVREAGIRDEPYVEAFVIIHHTLKKFCNPDSSVWQVLNRRLLSSADTTLQVGALEHRWHAIFSVLPLFEIGVDGVHHTGHRFQESFDNWVAVKSLVSRPFNLYTDTARMPSTTINEYVRILLSRCHHLAQAWGWQKCETIISFVFDFFGKRQFVSLEKEDKFSSSRSLEELAMQPSLEVLGDEKAFHIFLKLLAVGLRSMQKVYPEMKIRSIVWRWLPNHSRTYDKAKELRKEDLDALRNQHDLLCTMYWASPSSARPRLQLIQNLVDHTASHLEACRISVKAWARLAAFQLSTDEPVSAAEPFALWLKEMVEQNISQYKSARPELEAQHEAARSAGVATVSADKLDLMISRNQNGVIAVIIDAVVGLRTALRTASMQTAWTVLHNSNIQDVTTLFDAKNKRTNGLILETLSMFTTFVDTIDRATYLGSQNVLSRPVSTQFEIGSAQIPSRNSHGGNEESQDYGDWPEEEEDTRVDVVVQEPLVFVLEQVAHLLSSVMGSELSPSDEVLVKTTERWAYLSAAAVRHGVSSWDTFLSSYGKHSWYQLRDTPQRRKFGAHFLSHVLKQDRHVFRQHRDILFCGWLCSLVERDAQLKFQHGLTTDLLNLHPHDPLLQNLPFSKTAGTETYDISATELRERRLALLSSVLSNMRDEYHRCILSDPASVRSLRAEYASTLRQVMVQMRRNYEELRQGDIIAGAYVAFVQTMVEFMTQYTSDICAVDRYFTDSSSFPLPAGDPTYLVGRLKSYDGRLHDAKVVKQLIMFMQNVSERAAVDGEQDYLVSQLASAIDCGSDAARQRNSSLRNILLEVIFPAYIEASVDDSAAWILSRPVLLVCQSVFDGMLFRISATDTLAVQAVVHAMDSILSSMMIAVAPLEYAFDQIKQASVMSMLSNMLAVATTCIPTIDYLQRRCGVGSVAIKAIHYLRDFSLFAARVMMDDSTAFPPTSVGEGLVLDATKAEMKTFCARQLQQDLKERWKVEHGRYSVKRGTDWRDLQHITTTAANEQEKLIKSVLELHEALDGSESL